MKKTIEKLIFGSKWLLIPFYGGLIIALGFYCYVNLTEIFHMIHEVIEGSKEDVIMLTLLKLVDMAMIANLVKMIITGSYHSFVSKNHGDESEKSSSGILKVKMASSIIGVSSIHMLQTFINAENINFDLIFKQCWLHGAFIVGAVALAVLDYLHHKSEVHENIHTPGTKPSESSNTHH